MGLSSRDAEPRTAVPDRHRLLAAETRRAVLEALRRSGDEVDAAQLAAEVGRHVSTVRQHLELLARSGVVSRRVEQRTVRGRPRVLYAATTAREPDDGDGMMAMMLASQLAQGDDPAGQAELAGRRWGRALVQRDDGRTASGSTSRAADVGATTQRIVDLFDEVGFAPQARPERHGTVIELNRCPFLHVAQAHPEVACSLHLGLLRGALESLGSPVRADRLEPFVTPTLCRAHLVND
jgi:predicted ArsR family transcriptional regulator